MAASLGLVAIVVVPSALAGSQSKLLGSLVVAFFGLVIFTLVDGFARNAFSTSWELTRAVGGAAFVGAVVALALALRWPQAISPLHAATLAAGIALAGRLVADSAIVHGLSRGRLPRALVISSPARHVLQPQSRRVAREVKLVERLDLPLSEERLLESLARHRPQLVLVEPSLSELDVELLRLCSEHEARLLILADRSYALYGLALSRPIIRLGGLPWLSLRSLPLLPRQLRAKRALDLALVLLAAPFALPLMGLIAITVGVTSRGGVLYRQARIGEHGRRFVIHKFRTMRPDAERDSGAVFATEDDPRVTRVGRVLRCIRFDELPQLWNVLHGEMSLVGPRPERPELMAEFESIEDYDHRHLLKPGITGLAQLVGGYSASAEDKLRCDLLYVSSRSLGLDLRLLLATALDLMRRYPGG